MNKLGNPELTTELKQTIAEGVLREAGNRSVGTTGSGGRRGVTRTS